MDNEKMIRSLEQAGIQFVPGLTRQELDRAEETFGFRFPAEIRELFSCAFPVSEGFFDYRDTSPENLRRFLTFQEGIEDAFRFDMEHNALAEELGAPYSEMEKQQQEEAILAYLHSSTRLIPLYHHRCFFDGMDDMPILSFWQATDVIVYGKNLETYLKQEFLKEAPERVYLNTLGLEKTGIWGTLLR